MEELQLAQSRDAVGGDGHIAQHVELRTIPAQGRSGQVEVVIHHGGAVGQDDQLGILGEERGQRLGQRFGQHRLGRGEAAALCSQRGGIQLQVHGDEEPLVPVQPLLCPQQEGTVQLDGTAAQHHGLVRVDHQLAVDGGRLGE